MRDSAIIYRSFYEAIKELPEQNQAECWQAVFEFSLNFKEIKLVGISKTIFTLIKPQLEANIKRYHSGNAPKHKRNISKSEAKYKRNISKHEANANDNVNDNVNDNINDNVNEIQTTGAGADSVLFESIKKYFGFESEIKCINKWREIKIFLKSLKDISNFEHQFKYYQLYKIEAKEKIHSFAGFIDGGWDAENWEKKYNDFKKNNPNGNIESLIKNYKPITFSK